VTRAGTRHLFAQLAIALIVALAPSIGDICTLGCDAAAPPPCPAHESRHQPSPNPCGHDHSAMRADVARLSVAPDAFMALPLLQVPPIAATIDSSGTAVRSDRPHAPSDAIARTTALRI